MTKILLAISYRDIKALYRILCLKIWSPFVSTLCLCHRNYIKSLYYSINWMLPVHAFILTGNILYVWWETFYDWLFLLLELYGYGLSINNPLKMPMLAKHFGIWHLLLTTPVIWRPVKNIFQYALSIILLIPSSMFMFYVIKPYIL